MPKKTTMMKHRVGVARTSTYNLPDTNHTYGYTQKKDPEGAGDMISNWITTNPSSGKESSASHVHTNILAIKKGCITAASMRKYTQEHPNIRMKEILHTTGGASGSSMMEGPFGRKTVYSEDPFADIIQSKGTNFANDDADYPVLKGFVMHGYMPKPRATRSSAMAATHVTKKKEEEGKAARKFCMKRFQNIPGAMQLEREALAVAKSLDSLPPPESGSADGDDANYDM